MNGVFQPVTVIDTIIFWKVKDLLMWQTTVWETLKLHNSHCFQLNTWHDRLASLQRGGGEENSSNLCRQKHGFSSKQWFRYRQTGEIRDKKTWLALKIQIAGGWVSRLGNIKLRTCTVLIAVPGPTQQQGRGWDGPWADPAGRAAVITLPSARITPLSSATPGLPRHIHQTNMKQLSRSVIGSSFSITHICSIFLNPIFTDTAKNYEICVLT